MAVTLQVFRRKTYKGLTNRERKEIMTFGTFIATTALMFGVITMIAVHMGNAIER